LPIKSKLVLDIGWWGDGSRNMLGWQPTLWAKPALHKNRRLHKN
jgi:hypothetical protein